MRSLAPRQLERLYEIPRDCRSFEDYERARHRDLASLDNVELDCEGLRALIRLSLDGDRSRREWLIQRRNAIRQEQARRSRSRR